MIVLETNVVSEPWKPAPDRNVLEWLDAQAIETLYLTAITVAELRFGIALLPAGKRRKVLSERLEQSLLPLFSARILPFDLDASKAYAQLLAKASRQGLATGRADGYVAAIASARALTVATRDTAPFRSAGLRVIDPWAARADKAIE